MKVYAIGEFHFNKIDKQMVDSFWVSIMLLLGELIPAPQCFCWIYTSMGYQWYMIWKLYKDESRLRTCQVLASIFESLFKCYCCIGLTSVSVSFY